MKPVAPLSCAPSLGPLAALAACAPVLEADGAISTALPCRISVYGKPGAYQLATMLPTAMMGMFGKPELDAVAREVEGVIVTMMKDAAGG